MVGHISVNCYVICCCEYYVLHRLTAFKLACLLLLWYIVMQNVQFDWWISNHVHSYLFSVSISLCHFTYCGAKGSFILYVCVTSKVIKISQLFSLMLPTEFWGAAFSLLPPDLGILEMTRNFFLESKISLGHKSWKFEKYGRWPFFKLHMLSS